MLTRAPVMTMLPVKDLERARDFYVNKLGLEAEGLTADGKLVLRANGTKLWLIPKPEGTKAEHTAIELRGCGHRRRDQGAQGPRREVRGLRPSRASRRSTT